MLRDTNLSGGRHPLDLRCLRQGLPLVQSSEDHDKEGAHGLAKQGSCA